MSESKKKNRSSMIIGWLQLIWVLFRWYKRLKPKLVDSVRDLYITGIICLMEYKVSWQDPVKLTGYPNKQLLASEDRKITFIADRLSKFFLFKNDNYQKLKLIAAEYLQSGGVK